MLPVVIVVVAVAFVALFLFVDVPLMKRGREARAASGGRHTPAWWASLVAVLLVAGILLVLTH